MKNVYYFAAMALLSLTACNDREVFEKEQYKNIFGFVSESDNTKAKIVSLHFEETVTYMSISMGGTKAPDKDVKINIVEDEELISDYNKANFDFEVAKFSVALPKDKYEITSYVCTIKAGEFLGTIPVKIYPKGLSPDKHYIIPVRVETFDGAEINPKKSSLLMQIGIKNQWANSQGVSYSMSATRKTLPDGYPINMPGTKTVHCWEENSVRTTPGNITYSADVHAIDANSIILEINPVAEEDGYHKVTIRPLRDMKIEQVDGDSDYPNNYGIVNDGFNTYKVFRLHYIYTVGEDSYEMKEELRVTYSEDKDVDSGFEIINEHV